MSARSRTSAAGIFKVALIASAGATIEWYDFFIYGTAAALVFPKLFFPADIPPLAAQLAAFSTFAVGFIARPIGGVIFGHFGDVIGRKHALVTALMMMGVGTAAIGILPSYQTAGALAPILLVALRFLQGIAVGGQWGGAALLAIESAPEARRGFFGSFVQIGVPLGVVLANIVFLIIGAFLSPSDFLGWGWRIPFLLSVILVVVGIYVQYAVETPSKEQTPEVRAASRSPIISVILSHPREILLAGGTFVANNSCFYVAITYAVSYGTGVLHLPKSLMLGSIIVGSIVFVPALIICGLISDRWGRRPPFILGAVLTGAWAFAFFPLLQIGTTWSVVLAVTVELLAISLMYGPQAALFAELFPVEVRYSGATLGYQIGSVVGGGFAPLIATALFVHFGTSLAIAVYLAVMCMISLVSVILLASGRSTPRKAMGRSAPPVVN
jgi:MFS family permease